MGFNSETGEAGSGKGVIATGPRRATCTEAMTTQTLGKCVCARAQSEGMGRSLSRSHVTPQISCKTQPDV